jgi:transposase
MKMSGKDFNAIDFVKTCYGLDDFEIEKLDFNDSDLSLKIYAKLPLEKCTCKKCDGKFVEVHDWQDRTARLPPFGNYLDVTLYLKKPRGHCGNCLSIQSGKVFFCIPSSHPWLVALQNIVAD